MAIRSIRHGGLRRFFLRNDVSKLHATHVGRLKRILEALDEEDPLRGDLTAPTYRLHPLKGDRRGQWSVRVDRVWWIVFRVEDGSVFDVDLSDYH